MNPTASSDISPLSLHDALPISQELELHLHAVLTLEVDRVEMEHEGRLVVAVDDVTPARGGDRLPLPVELDVGDRKSTRLNSSHGYISYAVLCLNKKSNLILAAS